MKSLRIKLWLIAVITVLAALIDLPQSFPVEIPWGKQTLKRIIQAPRINLNLGSFSLQKSFDTRLGLDLSGGTHLVLQAEMDKISSPDRQKAFDSAKSTIERRINLFGLTEPVVQQAKVGDNYRIIVEIPGVTDINQAIDLIGTTAQLTFREEATSQASEATPSSFLEVWPKDSGLTGNNLIRSQVSYDTNTGSPQVALEFDSIGAKLFEQITESLPFGQAADLLQHEGQLQFSAVEASRKTGVRTGYRLRRRVVPRAKSRMPGRTDRFRGSRKK